MHAENISICELNDSAINDQEERPIRGRSIRPTFQLIRPGSEFELPAPCETEFRHYEPLFGRDSQPLNPRSRIFSGRVRRRARRFATSGRGD